MHVGADFGTGRFGPGEGTTLGDFCSICSGLTLLHLSMPNMHCVNAAQLCSLSRRQAGKYSHPCCALTMACVVTVRRGELAKPCLSIWYCVGLSAGVNEVLSVTLSCLEQSPLPPPCHYCIATIWLLL